MIGWIFDHATVAALTVTVAVGVVWLTHELRRAGPPPTRAYGNAPSNVRPFPSAQLYDQDAEPKGDQ